jgi:peptide/nickel transport system substrate-binding protein
MRKYYWYISIFLRKHGVLVLSSIIIAILVFSLSLPFLVRLFEFKKSTYIGIVGRYSLTDLPLPVQQEISAGLTRIEKDGSVKPDIAERWNTEDEGKTYRFLLKKNLFWQDGKEVEPSDIQYNFNDVQVITTSNEVIFKLKDQFVPFISIVSRPIVRIGTEPYLIFFKKKKIIGLGKSRVISYKEQGQQLKEVVVVSDEEQKVYRFYLTEDEAISAFKRGEVDTLSNFSSTGDISSWPNVQVNRKLDTSTYLGVFFNTQLDPFRDNDDLRQALNYALQKPSDETRAYGPINPSSWAYANVGKPYLYDEERALQRILSPNALPRQPLNLKLTTTSLFANEADAIKQQWEQFGKKAAERCKTSKDIKEKEVCENLNIQVEVNIENFFDLQDYQILLIAQETPTDPDQYALWHSKLPSNFTHYENARIDSLLERGRQIEDVNQRAEMYHDFQQFFSEDAPVIFLKYLYKYDIQRKGK